MPRDLVVVLFEELFRKLLKHWKTNSEYFPYAPIVIREPASSLALVKPWPNGLASRRKFAKPELAYGLAKVGQTDSQVNSQVTKSRKFHAYHWLMCQITCDQLVSTCAGWPHGK